MPSSIIPRKTYVQAIKSFIDKPIIKVITGMRRVGKSYLLRELDTLLRQNNAQDAVLYINKELMAFDFIRDYRELYNFVKSNKTAIRYLLIDEVQDIEKWERAIASLHAEGVDICLTGSNAHLLSSEMATLVTGRYVHFPVFSLSFQEFIEFHQLQQCSLETCFEKYLQLGGLPAIAHFSGDETEAYTLIRDMFDTILLKDVIQRHKIRSVSALDRIVHYAIDNIGNLISAKKISDHFRSQQIRISVDTVCDYLKHLSATYAIHHVQRYDIKGKRHLEIADKYYLGDISLRHAILGYQKASISSLLENIVYLELCRRGYKVSVGKIEDCEVDFLAERRNERLYIQVTYLLSDEQTIEREVRALEKIPDNYPKLILSMDKLLVGNLRGIQWANLVQWLSQAN